MIMLMGVARRSLIVVVMAVIALASAFDGCLMDCHTQAPAAVRAEAHAHCHPLPPQQAGLRWQADPTCHHDHTAAAAESAVRIRLDLRPLGITASLRTLSVRPLVSSSPVSRRSTTDRSGQAVALVALRV
jgi:hypothetical protein